MALGTPVTNAAAATSVTLPAHNIGDTIVIWAYNNASTTTPTKPAASGTVPAWTDIDNTTGANTNSSRSAYFVATATNHTSGTWTNATGMTATVISGAASSPIGGHAEAGGAAANAAQAPAVTLSKTDGTSALLEHYGHRTVTAWSTAPSGYTRLASQATSVCVNSKNSTTTDGAVNQSNTATNAGYRGAAVEILAPPKAATLTDPFNTQDASKWGGFSADNFVASGQLNINATPAYPLLNSAVNYDLTGSSAYVQLVQRPNIGTGSTNAILMAQVSSGNFAEFILEGATLYFREQVATVNSDGSVTFDPVAHAWWRLRESGGSIFWDTSPDGATWTNRRSKADGLSYASVQLQLSAGNWNSEASPGTAIFDNFNLPAPTPRAIVKSQAVNRAAYI